MGRAPLGSTYLAWLPAGCWRQLLPRVRAELWRPAGHSLLLPASACRLCGLSGGRRPKGGGIWIFTEPYPRGQGTVTEDNEKQHR